MKSEKLMDCIGQIDDGIIVEADVSPVKARPAGRPWIKWAAVAAVVACVVIAAPLIQNRMQPGGYPDDGSGLPKLAVDTGLDGLGFGYEGYLAYDAGELQNGNPWTENNDLTTMPVYRNPVEYDGAGAPVNGLPGEEMLAIAEKVANLFGLEITSLYTTPSQEQIEMIREKMQGEPEENIRAQTTAYLAAAECGGAKIEVQNDGHIVLTLTPETAGLAGDIGKLKAYDSFSVAFDFGSKIVGDTEYFDGLPLPGGRVFAFNDVPYEQAMEITQYLFSEYGAFTGITAPGYDLSADRTYGGVLVRLSTAVFENSGSLAERILNYHFNRIYFNATDLGGLGAIGYYKTDLSQKIGDYPIITSEEARALLLEKHYITTIPEAMPGEEYISRVELVYRTGRHDKVFMPYYKFLVEMPEMQRENGLKTFGVFYVPAVQNRYLEAMPLWDGSFN